MSTTREAAVADGWLSSASVSSSPATAAVTAAAGAASAAAQTSPGIQEVSLAVLLCVVILVTAVGNTLVIAAVLTTRRLRTVTNCFVMSLAVADWLVGIFVMPPAVAKHLMGSWKLGWILCDIWISLDVLLCTASILSLCAISVDRYLAVTRPLTYSRRRRSKRLAFGMILVVWLAALAITCPPILGWYEAGRHDGQTCRYNQNQGYVVFSAMGSFFLPMIVMVYVYCRISCVVAQRHDQLAHMDSRNRRSHIGSRENSELERASSECEDKHHITLQPQTLHKHHATDRHADDSAKSVRSHQDDTSRSVRSHLTYSFSEPGHHASRSRHECSEASTRVSSFRRESKTAQTLSIVVGGFIACWLPFFVYYLLAPFLPDAAISKVLMDYLTWLGWINSAINPFIYAFYSPDFRIAFWRLTVRRCAKGNKRAGLALQHK